MELGLSRQFKPEKQFVATFFALIYYALFSEAQVQRIVSGGANPGDRRHQPDLARVNRRLPVSDHDARVRRTGGGRPEARPGSRQRELCRLLDVLWLGYGERTFTAPHRVALFFGITCAFLSVLHLDALAIGLPARVGASRGPHHAGSQRSGVLRQRHTLCSMPSFTPGWVSCGSNLRVCI